MVGFKTGFKTRREGDLQRGRRSQCTKQLESKEMGYLASASTAIAFAVLKMTRLFHASKKNKRITRENILGANIAILPADADNYRSEHWHIKNINVVDSQSHLDHIRSRGHNIV